MGQVWSTLFPPPARLTEENLSNQDGRVSYSRALGI